jgi:hypothetical protein
MASVLKVLRNGVEILNNSLITRENLRDVITTETPSAETVIQAVDSLGGSVYVESLLSAGDGNDVYEIFEDDKLTGRATRKIIAAKMTVCLNRAEWMTERFTVKSGTRKGSDKGVIEVA